MVIIVKGRPVSVNAETARKQVWRAQVAAAATAVAAATTTDDDLRVVITFFYERLPDFDTDNISKPICDALQGIVYVNDNQIMERLARRRPIDGAYQIKGVDPAIVLAIAEGYEFVSIEIYNLGNDVVRI